MTADKLFTLIDSNVLKTVRTLYSEPSVLLRFNILDVADVTATKQYRFVTPLVCKQDEQTNTLL